MKCEEIREDPYTLWDDSATLSSSVLSIFCASFILNSYLSKPHRTGKVLTKLISLVAAGDFGWSLTNVVYDSLLLSYGNIGKCNYTWCLITRGTQQLFTYCTVFFTVCIAVHLVLQVFTRISHEDSRKDKKYFLTFFFIGLLLAVALDTTTLLLPIQVTSTGWCVEQEPYHFMFWFGPIAFSYLICTVCYVVIIAKYVTRFGCTRSDKMTVVLPLKLTLYIAVFLLTWSLDFLDYIFKFIDKPLPPWFSVVVNLFVNSQGSFNFLVYGMLNRGLRKQYTFKRGVLVFIIGPFLLPLVFIRWLKRMLEQETVPFEPLIDPYSTLGKSMTDVVAQR
jgi:hypothetical protein